jgi:squalene-associated FAD-dependent desaturase
MSRHPPPPPRVVIVGGGLAGLAAASALVDRGLRISLFESRPRLGGRASSFNDPVTNEPVDNCQHVSLGCCTNLAHFCRQVGLDGLLRREPELVFLAPDGRVSRLRAGRLPAPFHLAGSFLTAHFLSWPEKLRVVYGLARLCTRPDERPGEPIAAWLRRHGQTDRTIDRFWATVLVSALNELPEQMDVGHARKVFLDGFLANRDGYRMEIPTVPLGELYGTRLETWLGSHGVTVRKTTSVRRVEIDEEGDVLRLVLRSGELVPAEFVVLAVPFDRVRDLLAPPLAERIPALAGVDALQPAPITGVHLWFDRPVCAFDHVVTVGRMIQWVFNHTSIQGRRPGDAPEGQYLQVVMSASYGLLERDKTEIRDAVLAELAEIWPEVGSAGLLRWWVVTERAATFAVRPGVDAHRPRQRTPVDGLFLAGDFTATGWPGTMEGAVRSGYLAAEEVLQDLGSPRPILQPDLPPGRLARWLLRPSRRDIPSKPAQRRATTAVPAERPTSI